MRNLFMAAVATAAVVLATPATAALTLVGTFAGNQCDGAGGFTACYASGTTAGTGAVLKTAGGSPSIIRIENGGNPDISTSFPTITGSEFAISYNGGTNTLSFTYTAGAGDPVAHYLGIFQGGSAVGGSYNNTYDLFYDPNPITSGSIALSTYFQNTGWSHIDFFDTGTPAVPEPATWALMLVGFAGMGSVLRRSRRRQGQLLQLA